jgi:hypothetical protein
MPEKWHEIAPENMDMRLRFAIVKLNAIRRVAAGASA